MQLIDPTAVITLLVVVGIQFLSLGLLSELGRGGQDPHGVGSPEGTDHGRRVLHFSPGDEMLEQRETRIVQRDVGGGLSAGRWGRQNAGQGGRDKENAN